MCSSSVAIKAERIGSELRLVFNDGNEAVLDLTHGLARAEVLRHKDATGTIYSGPGQVRFLRSEDRVQLLTGFGLGSVFLRDFPGLKLG